MNWIELKKKIYYCDGSLRDIYILHTNLEDNKKWIDFANKRYTVKWFNGLTQNNEQKINVEVVEGYLKGKHHLSSSASIYIDKIQINNHFFVDNEIENDISPKDINSLEDHEKIINYMTDLSSLLNKPVILTPENEQETILLSVTEKGIQYLPKNR